MQACIHPVALFTLWPVGRLLRVLVVVLVAAMSLAIGAAVARAQEYIYVPGIASDEDFYRLVACAAPPGGDCAKPMIRWPDERRMHLRVGIAGVADTFQTYKFDLIDRAIDEAIAQINASGAALVLTRAYEGDLDVSVFLVETPQGGVISGTSLPDLDGADMAIARVALRSRGDDIVAASIALSQDVRRREITSVVLEELVQAMGLPTDIDGPAYHQTSIFAEYSNATVFLRGQDAAALRRHYPRP